MDITEEATPWDFAPINATLGLESLLDSPLKVRPFQLELRPRGSPEKYEYDDEGA